MNEEDIDFNQFIIQEKKDKGNKEFVAFRKNSDINEGIVLKFDTMHRLKEYFKSAGITFPDESAPIKIKPKVEFSPIPEDEQAFIPDEPVELG